LERFRLAKLKSSQLTTETLALMFQLYVDQTTLSADVLKQILAMQQNQMGVEPDPMLMNSDFSLFGFKSIEDWFGPRFVSLVGQFILNSAQIAEERGYEVKAEEVRADLFKNIYHGYRQASGNTKLSSQEVGRYYQMKMRSLGLDEKTLIGAWRKVMLFRRLFEDGSGSVLVDPLAYQQFEHFAKENVHIALYQLPAAFRFADFRAMLKFQLYLEGIAANPSGLREDLRMPKQIASLEQIEKRVPEIVERKLELEWSAVSKSELCRSISIKDTWEWEASHWEILQKSFPELVSADTKQLRLSALNSQDEKARAKIDQFAREQMVEQNADGIKAALQNAVVNTSTLGLKMKGGEFPFSGIKDSAELTGLLEKASLKAEVPNAAAERLAYFTADAEHFYSIQVVSREDSKRVLTFAEASRDGTLDSLLAKKLEGFYPDVRKKDARYFQQSNGLWKPFKEVRDEVGKYVFADLLKSIEGNYRSIFGMLPGKEGELPLHFYSNARMGVFMKEAQSALMSDPADARWVKVEEKEGFARQWLLERTEEVMQRCAQVPFSKEEMFTLSPQQWSGVKMGERGFLAFYFVKEKGKEDKPSLNSLEEGHQILSFDAKRDMMLQVMQRIQQKRAIGFSHMVAQES
jgi:hypothetical protein